MSDKREYKTNVAPWARQNRSQHHAKDKNNDFSQARGKQVENKTTCDNVEALISHESNVVVQPHMGDCDAHVSQNQNWQTLNYTNSHENCGGRSQNIFLSDLTASEIDSTVAVPVWYFKKSRIKKLHLQLRHETPTPLENYIRAAGMWNKAMDQTIMEVHLRQINGCPDSSTEAHSAFSTWHTEEWTMR